MSDTKIPDYLTDFIAQGDWVGVPGEIVCIPESDFVIVQPSRHFLNNPHQYTYNQYTKSWNHNLSAQQQQSQQQVPQQQQLQQQLSQQHHQQHQQLPQLQQQHHQQHQQQLQQQLPQQHHQQHQQLPQQQQQRQQLSQQQPQQGELRQVRANNEREINRVLLGKRPSSSSFADETSWSTNQKQPYTQQTQSRNIPIHQVMPTNQSESPAIPDISQSDCLAQWGPSQSKRQAQWGPDQSKRQAQWGTDQSNGQDKRFSQPEYRQHSSSNLFTQKKTKVSVNSDYHSSGGDNEFSSGQTESSSQSESSSDSTEEEEEEDEENEEEDEEEDEEEYEEEEEEEEEFEEIDSDEEAEKALVDEKWLENKKNKENTSKGENTRQEYEMNKENTSKKEKTGGEKKIDDDNKQQSNHTVVEVAGRDAGEDARRNGGEDTGRSGTDHMKKDNSSEESLDETKGSQVNVKTVLNSAAPKETGVVKSVFSVEAILQRSLLKQGQSNPRNTVVPSENYRSRSIGPRQRKRN